MRVGVWLVLCACICLLFPVLLWMVLPNLGENKLTGEVVSSLCWVPKGREYCAPQFIVAGGMKCGTTSLWSYLLEHPKVLPLQKVQIDPKKLRTVLAEKEVRFFTDGAFKQLSKAYGWETAVNYYLDLFYPIPPTPDSLYGENYGKITGEASPMYISSRGIAQRVYDALPEVKIIMMLRNPIDRAYSDYWFRKNLKIKSNDIGRFDISGFTHGEIFQQCMEIEFEIMEYCKLNEFKDDPSFESLDSFINCYRSVTNQISKATESSDVCKKGAPLADYCIPDAIKDNCQNHGLQIGMYVAQVYEWLEVFPRKNILIIQSEEFYESTPQVMEEVSQFLHIDDIAFDWNSVTGKTFNIINPTSAAGLKLDLVTNNKEAKNSLQVGASNSTSEYPPLDPVIRGKLNEMVAPYNKALAKLLNNKKFLWDSSLNQIS